MTARRVSVVMATYNMGRFLGEAIDSVIGQDYRPLELIVVDDGSTDNTGEVLERYVARPEVRIVRQANGGQTVAKNRGLQEASGDYVGFCDADNVWLPGKIARQLPLFDRDGRVGVVYGECELIDGAGASVPHHPMTRYEGRITRQLVLDNFVTFNTALVTRRAIDMAGGFNRKLRMAIDYDLWLRISTQFEFRFLPEPLAKYRVWEGQMSHDLAGRLENAFLLLEDFFEEFPEAVSRTDRRRAWAYSLVSRARWRSWRGEHSLACRDLVAALAQWPVDRRAWRSAARVAVNAVSPRRP
jgi:glycosyltransferase involved in cell wall biosynthesis